MSSSCHLQLLGGLRIQCGQESITRFRSQKFGALLAYLALFPNRLHTREELTDLLWPDADPELGRGNLRTALASLRRQLEPPGTPSGSVIVVDGRTYISLNPDNVGSDVATFTKNLAAAVHASTSERRIALLEEAVRQYGGPLLPGYYEDWVLAERERLAESHSRAMQQLVQLYREKGDRDSALDTARRLVATEPLQEEAHGLVIGLLQESGQSAAAKRQFDELARLLKEKLGTEPSKEVRALLERVPAAPKPVTPTQNQFAVGTARPVTTNRASVAVVTKEAPAIVGPRNIPRFVTRFFGREDEIAAIQNLLRDMVSRLVTLTGPGGSGKTRVAVETVRDLAEVFPQGIWYVPLADLREADRLPEAIADALGLTRRTTADARQTQITEALRSESSALLVLDNFEQIADDGAPYVSDLLAQVPNLRFLVTSRQRLRLEGEREFPLLPLPVPEFPGTPERLWEFPSVQLFVARAQEVRADFQLTERNAASVAALCAKLEGIPLAIELAAAWAGMLSPSQILQRMEKRLDLLVSRRRDVAPRHRTLRAAMESSVELLEAPVQVFFAALAVFHSGWTLEAAEAILDEPLALDYLTTLRDHSLIQSEASETGGEVRFRMLETLREFASERLASDEAKRAEGETRHTAYFTRLVEEAVPRLSGPEQAEWLQRLEADHDNLRAILQRLSLQNNAQEALRLVGMLTGFWASRGHLTEGRQRIDALLAQVGDTVPALLRARALSGGGKLAYLQADYTAARAQQDACLAIYRAENDAEGMARTLNELGNCEMLLSNYAAATTFFEDSLAGYRALNDKRGIALLLNNLGAISLAKGLPAVAKPYLEESLPLSREIGHFRNVAITLVNLATIWQAERVFDKARTYFEESLTIRREQGDLVGTGTVLEGLGRLAMEEGDANLALLRLDESIALRRKIQYRDGIASALLHRGLTYLKLTPEREKAWESLTESLTLSQEIGNRHFFSDALDGLATLLVTRQDYARAVQLWAFADSQRKALGVTPKPAVLQERDREIAAVRAILSDSAFEAAWEQGRSLSQAGVANLLVGLAPT